MGRAQFEYDEQGNTFYYFCVSFYALVLIPFTYYFWPSSSKTIDIPLEKECNCNPCRTKKSRKQQALPWRFYKNLFVGFLILIGWFGFIALVYKVSMLTTEHVEYDPYAILQIDSGASATEIKKQYRKLSMLHHPDRGGDPQEFVKIAKAYEALTDEDVRANWEKYGNPDGPGAMRFGIALPSWIVDKSYSFLVLGSYFLVFMVVLPVVVGTWWYTTMRYSAEQVLLETSRLYGYFFHKSSTTNMLVKRCIMLLGASYEFDSFHNKEVVIRPTDGTDIKALIKELPSAVGETNKERPFCYPHSVKTRALIFAHLCRIEITNELLQNDQRYILCKTPILIQEMIMMSSYQRHHVETVENVMKLSAMIVQALLERDSPLLQLPHFTSDILRHCVTKKRHVRTCRDLAVMEEADRLSLLRYLDDAQYRNVMKVLSSLPDIEMDVKVEVQDDEDKSITAGSLVTVYVELKRQPLEKLFKGRPSTQTRDFDVKFSQFHQQPEDLVEDVGAPDDEGAEEAEEAPAKQSQHKPWERNKKKKAKTITKKKPQQPTRPKKTAPASAPDAAAPADGAASEKQKTDEAAEKEQKEEASGNESDSEDNGDEEKEENAADADDADAASDGDAGKAGRDKNDDYLFDDVAMRKERLLERKSKVTHLVHCPYFPQDKYEWWWVYLCDRKAKCLLSPAQHVTSLVTSEKVELKFTAPSTPGQYAYQVCLRSDSYLDCDQNKDIKITVKPAVEVKSHPQWDFPEEPGDAKEESSDGSAYTEHSDSEGLSDA